MKAKVIFVVATADGERNNTAIVVLDLLKFIEILPSGGFARKYVCNIFTMLDISNCWVHLSIHLF